MAGASRDPASRASLQAQGWDILESQEEEGAQAHPPSLLCRYGCALSLVLVKEPK